jgi:hypothetical protein
LSDTNLTKTGTNSGAPEGKVISATRYAALVKLLLIKIRWWSKKEERRTRLWLQRSISITYLITDETSTGLDYIYIWVPQRCLIRSRYCLPFVSIWVHLLFLMGSVLLNYLIFCVVLCMATYRGLFFTGNTSFLNTILTEVNIFHAIKMLLYMNDNKH